MFFSKITIILKYQDNPKHLFRPWGFQSGHQIEWAKLLVTLYNQLSKAEEETEDDKWMIESAKSLFCRAYEIAWDKKGNKLHLI